MILRRLYGAGPAHLLGHLLAFAFAAYALFQILGLESVGNILIWFVAAVLLHDALLWPLYSAADRLGQRGLGRWVNYVRIPVGLALLLPLVFISTITGKGSNSYLRVSTFSYEGYVVRWLGVTAILFLLTGAVSLYRSQPRGTTR